MDYDCLRGGGDLGTVRGVYYIVKMDGLFDAETSKVRKTLLIISFLAYVFVKLDLQIEEFNFLGFKASVSENQLALIPRFLGFVIVYYLISFGIKASFDLVKEVKEERDREIDRRLKGESTISNLFQEYNKELSFLSNT